MWTRLRRWWRLLWQRRYPIIRVEWGISPLESAQGQMVERDCGHYSRSFAYDPLRESSMCLDCYRASVGKRPRVRR